MPGFVLRLLLAFALSSAMFAHAAEPGRNLGAVPAEKKVALVIGNGAYPGVPLKNPANDARDMAAALRTLGFEVIERTNVTQKEMNRAITQFGAKLTAGSVALFFYAGHGIQVKGKNYLLPVDAQIDSEASVRAETVDVDTLLDQLTASPLNIVILDACRNNPFERRFRGVGGGLAQMEAPKGTLIAYATSPGKVASDGDGKNGLYTQELLKVIRTPGLEVEKAFKRVRANVARTTRDNQIPWESSSLTGDFFFSRGAGPSASSASTPLQSDAELEQEHWDSVKNSSNPEFLRSYLSQYPKGRFAALAATKLAALNAGAAKPPAIRTVRLAIDDRLDGNSVYPHPVCDYVRPVSSLLENSITNQARIHAPGIEFIADGDSDAELRIRPVKIVLKAVGPDSDLINVMSGAIQVQLLQSGKALMTKTFNAGSTHKYAYGFSCSAWDDAIDAELKRIVDEMVRQLLLELSRPAGTQAVTR